MTTHEKLQEIKKKTEKHFGFSIKHRTGERVSQSHTDAKFIYSSLARMLVKDATVEHIGRVINRDHSSVLHQIKKADVLLDVDNDFLKNYLQIWSKCLASFSTTETEKNRENENKLRELLKRYKFLNDELENVLIQIQSLQITL